MAAPQKDQYDYIVVGAGSAGCIVASRLASAGHSVLLLEAGEPTENHPETLSADGFKYAFANDALMWHRMTAKQSGCGNRSLYAGSGRGMGGSGSVNGMVYTRGDRRDFEHWPKGWQWDDVTPAFAAVERTLGVQPRPATKFVKRFIQACTNIGMQHKDHLNDGDLGGYVGCNDINFEGQDRISSYRNWLHNQNIPSLEIITQAQVERLLFDEQRAAIGLIYRKSGRHKAQVAQGNENGEIILCAGALETPKLLMQSGVGPRRHLSEVGVTLVCDAPGVGQNLQDHPNVCLFYRGKNPVDFAYPQIYAFDEAERPKDQAPQNQPDSCYVCYAAPASIKHSTLRMLPILALPGSLYKIAPLRWLLRGLIHMAFSFGPLKAWLMNVFGIVVILGKPSARGAVKLRSNRPGDTADIDLAYYSTASDRKRMIAAVKKAKRIADQPVWSLSKLQPVSTAGKTISDASLWRWITKATMTTFHYCGTCRMGEDNNSPIDLQLRVKGVKNVRVADASVFPEIPVSAINAPSMMVGYRASDLILKKSSVLGPSLAPPPTQHNDPLN